MIKSAEFINFFGPHKACFTLIEDKRKSYVLCEYTENDKDIVLIEPTEGDGSLEVGRKYNGCCYPDAVCLPEGEMELVYTAWLKDRWCLVNSRIKDEKVIREDIIPSSCHAFRSKLTGLNGGDRLFLSQTESREKEHFISLREKVDGVWKEPIILSDLSAFSARPDISTLSEKVIVVWDSYSAGQYDIFGSIFDCRNEKPGEPFRISTQPGWNLKPQVTFFDKGSFIIVWINTRDVIGGDGAIDQRHSICGAIIKGDGRVQALGNQGYLTEMNHGIIAKLEPKPEQLWGYLGRRRHLMLKSDGKGRAYLLWERKKKRDEPTGKACGELCGLLINDGKLSRPVSLDSGRLFYEVDKNYALTGEHITLGALSGGPLEERNLLVSTIDMRKDYPELFTDDYSEWKDLELPFKDALERKWENFYWGDIHVHTQNSTSDDLWGEVDEVYHYARDKALLDFICITDNDSYCINMRESEWLLDRFYADFFNQEGMFVTLHGFEWSSATGPRKSNHRSVLMKEGPLNIPRWTIIGPEVEKLHKICKENGWISHAHHQNWRLPDNHSDANLEATACWGIYIEEGTDIYKALNAGFAGGIIGGSDTHRRNPGLAGALTCIHSDILSREKILEALRSSRAYATNGHRIYARFDFEDASKREPVFKIEISSGIEIKKIDIIRDGKVIHSKEMGINKVSFSWADKEVKKGRHWYLLKVEIDAPNTPYPAHLSTGRGGLAWIGPLRYERSEN